MGVTSPDLQFQEFDMGDGVYTKNAAGRVTSDSRVRITDDPTDAVTDTAATSSASLVTSPVTRREPLFDARGRSLRCGRVASDTGRLRIELK